MADFDAEYHLRRHAEDELGADDGERTVPARARALVALGLLTGDRARSILQQYGRARALRNGGEYYDDDEEDGAPVAGRGDGADARVVMLDDQAVQVPFGTIHLRYVTLDARRARLAVKIDFGKGAHGPRFMRGISVDIADDQGATSSLHFSGGGGNRVWRGQFTSEQPISPTTAWIKVGGQRVELVEHVSRAVVSVRDVAAETGPDVTARAERYLEHCLEGEADHHWGASTVSTVLDTLLASGSLAADSPAVVGARAVQRARSLDAVADPQLLSERWRSILTPVPRKRRAPKGDLPVAAATPVFDGLRLTVFVLSSRRSEFEVELDGHGAYSDGLPPDDDNEAPLTFTALDDVGNHYLGHTGDWHSGGSEFGGTVTYHPPLDPAAHSLELRFNTPRSQAVVQVPLTWAAVS